MVFNANRRLAWLFVFLLAVPSPFSGAPPQEGAAVASRALPQKEALSYNIEWRLVTAGKAQLDWNAMHSTGSAGWEARLRLESTGLVSKLFKVNDLYTSRLRRDLCAVASYIDALEGRRHRETDIAFDGGAGRAKYVEKDLLSGGAVIARKETEIPACVYDVVGALFKLRTMQLEPGQSAQIPVSDGKKFVMARVEAQQREELRTPAGNFKTVRYEAYLFNGVLFQRSAHLHVWLTDDSRKVPVQIRIRLQFTVGTITFQLEREQRS